MAKTTAPETCKRCGAKRDELKKFTFEGGSLALVHGHYSWWCDLCIVGTQLDYARERAAAIPKLEKELDDLEGKYGTKYVHKDS